MNENEKPAGTDDTKAVEEKPAEKPAESKPEEKPAEKPGETKPETKTEEKPGAEPQKAAEQKPAEDKKPVAPDKYELTVPDNSLLTDADLESIAADAKALGLTNEQAQQLAEARADDLTARSAAYLADAKADPEIGGANFETTVTHAQAGLTALFLDDAERTLVRDWFNRTGLGNHKTFLRAMARVGKGRQEDRPGGTVVPGAGGAARKSDADVLFGDAKS